MMEVDSFLCEDDLDVQLMKEDNNENDSIYSLETTIVKPAKKNPVEEHLLEQLHFAHNQIDQVNSNIEIIENVTEKILKNLAKQTAYREDRSSESDSDLYSDMGEPVVKRKRNRFYERKKVMEILHIWQRVIDDKWIIGVHLESTTTCVLNEPTIYVCLQKPRSDNHGVSTVWSLVDDSLWQPTEIVAPKEEVIATVTLDLPSFDEEAEVAAYGTFFCEFDDKQFQTHVPPVSLKAQAILDGSCAVKFDESEEDQFSVLALKACSVDRVVLLPMQPDAGTGRRLVGFLDKYEFKEICKVCVVIRPGALQYCLLEVMPAEGADIRVILSARSEAQLSVVIQMMREDIPELVDLDKQQALDDAAEALRQELQLYLTSTSEAELQRARIKTDLLIP